MFKGERLFMYAAVVALGLMAARGEFGSGEARAASGRSLREPPVARVATCDVYHVMQALVESERYKPDRQAEQEEARAELKEIAEQIKSLEEQLKSMDPKDDKALEVFREFNSKKEVFAERQAALDEFLGTQFVAAYEEVRKAADAVAEREGYTHVIVSRRAGEKPPTDMDRITQQMLSRPVLRSPAGDDITDDVLAELKL